YYRELGIYDFYRREPINASATPLLEEAPLRESASEHREEMPRKSAVLAKPVESDPLPVLTVHPEQNVADTVAALRLIREDLGDCTRCKLHQQGRKQIVFGVGNPRADLMFVGEGPGADEVAQGAVSAKNLLAINAPMSELRGRFYDFMPTGARSSDPEWQGAKLAVTYHPAFLLRDPRQKGEAWKDLQMVMKFLGLKPATPV